MAGCHEILYLLDNNGALSLARKAIQLQSRIPPGSQVYKEEMYVKSLFNSLFSVHFPLPKSPKLMRTTISILELRLSALFEAWIREQLRKRLILRHLHLH